jgi:hypothetical protein
MIAILPPAIQGLGNAGGFQLATEDRRNADLNALQQATDVVVAAANAEPGLAGVFTTYRSQVPQLYLNIDREKAERSATIMSIRQPSFKALRPPGVSSGQAIERWKEYAAKIYLASSGLNGRN